MAPVWNDPREMAPSETIPSAHAIAMHIAKLKLRVRALNGCFILELTLMKMKSRNNCISPLLMRNFCSIAAGAQYTKVQITPRPRVVSPSNGSVGLSKSSFLAKPSGTGTSAVAKSMFGNVLRRIGTPISAGELCYEM